MIIQNLAFIPSITATVPTPLHSLDHQLSRIGHSVQGSQRPPPPDPTVCFGHPASPPCNDEDCARPSCTVRAATARQGLADERITTPSGRRPKPLQSLQSLHTDSRSCGADSDWRASCDGCPCGNGQERSSLPPVQPAASRTRRDTMRDISMRGRRCRQKLPLHGPGTCDAQALCARAA